MAILEQLLEEDWHEFFHGLHFDAVLHGKHRGHAHLSQPGAEGCQCAPVAAGCRFWIEQPALPAALAGCQHNQARACNRFHASYLFYQLIAIAEIQIAICFFEKNARLERAGSIPTSLFGEERSMTDQVEQVVTLAQPGDQVFQGHLPGTFLRTV